jgi:hypothetical protein
MNKIIWKVKWVIAKWHWRCWLRYEGMPKRLKTTEEMGEWNKKLIEMQQALKHPVQE